MTKEQQSIICLGASVGVILRGRRMVQTSAPELGLSPFEIEFPLAVASQTGVLADR